MLDASLAVNPNQCLMTDPNVPLISNQRYFFELENGHFVKIDLRPNANDDWVVEHLDNTGEFVAGLQIEAPSEE